MKRMGRRLPKRALGSKIIGKDQRAGQEADGSIKRRERQRYNKERNKMSEGMLKRCSIH